MKRIDGFFLERGWAQEYIWYPKISNITIHNHYAISFVIFTTDDYDCFHKEIFHLFYFELLQWHLLLILIHERYEYKFINPIKKKMEKLFYIFNVSIKLNTHTHGEGEKIHQFESFGSKSELFFRWKKKLFKKAH